MAVVGRSSRTPVKHYLLNRALGKVCGVLSLDRPSVPCRVSNTQPFVCVDLCGGDGLKNESHDASPSIMYKHCEWLGSRGKKANLTVIEKAASTFEALQDNCQYMNPSIVSFSCSDARDYRLPKMSETQAAFVHCDPNTVDQTPLSKPFVAGFNCFTTYLVTLGCNVGGIKMTTLDKRAGWFEYVRILVEVLPNHHDAVLYWLNFDASQWAYLLSFPSKWSDEFKDDAIHATSKIWTKGVSAVSYRRQPKQFHDQLCKLFLTKEEYEGK